METLIIQAPGLIQNPGPNNPRIDLLDERLVFAFDANDLTLSDGATVTAWPNLGGQWGAGADTVADGPVTFDADGVGPNNAAVQFADSSMYSGVNPNKTGEFTFLCLLNFTYVPQEMRVFSGVEGTAYLYGRILQGGGNSTLYVGGQPTAPNITAVIPSGEWMVLEMTYEDDHAVVYLNGEQVASGEISPSGMTGITIGGNVSRDRRFAGAFGALRGYHAILNEQERAYFREMWLARVGA